MSVKFMEALEADTRTEYWFKGESTAAVEAFI